MKVLYYHMPFNEGIPDFMYPTYLIVNEVLKRLKGFECIDVPTPKGEDFAMFNGLKNNWGKDDILILGQDNVPFIPVLLEMQKCNHVLCTNPCLHYPSSTDREDLVLNCLNKVGIHRKFVMPTERPDYVDLAGTGCCKLSYNFQQMIDIDKVEPFHYQAFDDGIWKMNRYGLMYKWYCHYPLHYHFKPNPMTRLSEARVIKA